MITRQMSLLMVFIALSVFVISAENDGYSVILSWISNVIPLMFLSYAAAIIISSGQIDISTGAVMSLLGMILVLISSLSDQDVIGIVIAHFVTFVVGISIYAGMSLLVTSRISSLIVTLSIFFIAKGISTFIQACMQGVGSICRGIDGNLDFRGIGVISSDYIFSIIGHPMVSLVLGIGLVILVLYWRYHTRTGLEHVAVGMNKTAAHIAGIDIQRVTIRAFLAAGLLVSLATVLRLHGQTYGGWTANTGWGEELLAIAIAIIGGTRITGGKIDPISIALAALVVYSIRDVATNDLRLPSEMASIAFGILMAFVVWLDVRRQKNRA